MFIASLPIVILLFFTFPRISYKKSNFGFKGESKFITGFGDNISFGSGKELFSSNRVVMEVMFEDKIPSDRELYFRGAVLYDYDGDGNWSTKEELKSFSKLPSILYPSSSPNSFTNYSATIYPTFDKRVAQLDYPYSFPKVARIDVDYTIKLSKELFKTKKFDFTSNLNTKLKYIDPTMRNRATQIPNKNPRIKELAKKNQRFC